MRRSVKDRLEARREELQRMRRSIDMGGMQDSELSTEDQHPADQGTETFEREKIVSIIARFDVELADIERALRRVEEGTYGACEACGRKIAQARLEAVPAARFCIDDQALAEREARAS